MKYEWRKSEKGMYIPKNKPQIIQVPSFKYFTIKGAGNPNCEEFKEDISILYSLSYAIRMLNKKSEKPEGYFEYTVYPLEGVWDLTEEGRLKEKLDKNDLLYTIMIRQPEFVTDEVVKYAFDTVRKKTENTRLNDVKFETIEDGLSVQMMHIGPFDDEAKTFDIMKEFIKENNLEINNMCHREIYISDFRKTEQSKLKTVLRYTVSKL